MFTTSRQQPSRLERLKGASARVTGCCPVDRLLHVRALPPRHIVSPILSPPLRLDRFWQQVYNEQVDDLLNSEHQSGIGCSA